jgi:acetyl-CoA synthetase
MIYTSGTTGDPKGVLHAHRFLYGHLPCLELSLGWFPAEGDVGWTPADWAWIGGLMDMALPCLFYGVPLVSHRFAKFDPDAALRLMADEGGHAAFIPPTALRLMRRPRKRAVPEGPPRCAPSARAGEALGGDLLDWGRGALGCPINEFYGQTECNLVVASVDRVMERVPGAMGLPVPGHEVAVLGPGDKPVRRGRGGRGLRPRARPGDVPRILGQTQATAEKVRGRLAPHRRSGDDARRRPDGVPRPRRRRHHLGGLPHRPGRDRAGAGTHPDVVMAAVVGEPDPVRTEVVVAHVVLREGADWTGCPRRCRRWCATRSRPIACRAAWSAPRACR